MTLRVFRHARIHTGVPGAPPAQALAVDGDRVVAVGTESEVRRALGSRASELVDLDGAAVLPGLIDAHLHSAMLARSLHSVDLRDATDLAEVARRVGAHSRDLDPQEWMFGGHWDANLWPQGEQPHRAVLDAAAPGRAIGLISADCHSMWASSAALGVLGIDDLTPDPPGGQIVRDEAGVATGLLLEAAAFPLQAIEASPAGGDLESMLRRGQDLLLSVGLTSVCCFDGEDVRAAYLDLHAHGSLRLRVTKSIPSAALEVAVAEGRRSGDGDDWLRTGPVKIFSDGALGSHTCHMSHEFDGEPGNLGIEVTPPEELDRLITLASTHGIRVATHAIGDRANHLVLDAYERTASLWQGRLQHRIEHVQHIAAPDLPRMARLGVIASMQPSHAPSDIDLVDGLLAGRGLRSYAWRSMLDAGVPLAFGSDAPVETADPFDGLAAAITRTRPDGTPAGGWQLHEALTLPEALHAYGPGAARSIGREADLGTLEPGRLADLVVLDRDPYAEPAASLRDTRVLHSLVGGEVRWSRS